MAPGDNEFDTPAVDLDHLVKVISAGSSPCKATIIHYEIEKYFEGIYVQTMQTSFLSSH